MYIITVKGKRDLERDWERWRTRIKVIIRKFWRRFEKIFFFGGGDTESFWKIFRGHEINLAAGADL